LQKKGYPGQNGHAAEEMSMGRPYRSLTAWVVLVAFSALAIPHAAAQVAWVKGLDAALKQAAAEKKFVVLDISEST